MSALAGRPAGSVGADFYDRVETVLFVWREHFRLTDKEVEVLRTAAAQDVTLGEIAQRLGQSSRTTEKHVEAILRKTRGRRINQVVGRLLREVAGGPPWR